MNKEITEKALQDYDKLKGELELYKKLQVPICVYGEIGKTRYLKSIIPDLIIIDSREISDIRNLSGFYAIDDGEITYVEGILITALKNGSNILFKNIDQNINLLYFLNSVIKHKQIVNNKGEIIKSESTFNLFFTARERFKTSDIYFVGPIRYSWNGSFNYSRNMDLLLERVICLFNESATTKCDHNINKDCYKTCLSGNTTCFDGVSICLSKERNLCSFHYKKVFQMHEIIRNKNLNSHDSRLFLYDNFTNLFLNHDSEELLSILNLNYYPDIIIYDLNIVKTYAYKLAIRNVLNNIKSNKYSLLLGETGIGKTSVIQYICNNSQKYLGYSVNLKIVNMSPDYDGYDLVGGYGSLDIPKKISELYSNYLIEKPKILDNLLLLRHLKDLIEDVNTKKEIEFLEKCVKNKTNFIWKDGILTDAMKNGYWILLDEINLCNDEALAMIDSLVSKKEIVNYERKSIEKIKIHENFMLFACMNPGNDQGKKNFYTNNFNMINFYDFTDNISDIKLIIKSYVSKIFDDKIIDDLADLFFYLKQSIRKKELTNKIEPLISGRTLIRCLEAIKKYRNMHIMDIFSVFILTQFDLHSRSLVFIKMCKFLQPVNNKIVSTYQDLDYILTPKTQLIMYDINTSISLNCPILLQGDTSTGKTSIIYYLAEKNNHKVIRINNHEHTEASDYLGNYVSTPEGLDFKESLFIKAVRNGWWVILDELNLAHSDVLEVLNRLLDDNKEIYLPQKDELIKAHPDFRLFATQNIEYGGRKGISRAFRNRFIEIFFAEKNETEILEILHIKTGLPKSFCTNMVQIYVLLKNQRNIDNLITLRDLFKWANRIPRTMYEVYETGLSIIYERQRSNSDRKKVLEIFRKVFTKIENYNFDYSENEKFIIGNECIANFSKNMILTNTIVKLIKLLNAAIKCKEPILLIGETGIGKTKICEIFSKILGRKFIFVNMHSGTESSDFLGNFTLENLEIKWKNGPLLDAMIDGDCFLIDEINLAEDSVLERLNSLLEDKREIFVTETDINYKANDNFIIFATMNPGNDFGKKELSPALRNRFTEIYYDFPIDEIHQIFEIMLLNRNIKKPIFYDEIIRSVCSLRNFELFCDFFAFSKKKDHLIKLNPDLTEDLIAREAFALSFGATDNLLDNNFIDSDEILGINPYFIYKQADVRFDFSNNTTLINLKKVLRALVVQKGIMLEGEPGVGKTSIVSNLAKLVGKKCIRINLSEQTELSDLVGTYLPIENGIKFIPSQLSIALEKGWWIVLDEINLCSQSVIEGLNSVLDYRKTLNLPEYSVIVHPETKIFATMNPYNSLNGRKILPKSFIDRFVSIYMEEYSEDDIKKILEKLFTNYTFHNNCSLRENIKRNTCPISKSDIEYEIQNDRFKIGQIDLPTNILESKYVLLHSQLNQLEMIFSTLLNKIPLIITSGFGKGPLLEFISLVLKNEYFEFMCHKEFDTSDLLGQYHKTDDGFFAWKNSLFIDCVIKGSLIVLHNPELVEKSIFDRCNSLFETERYINIYEKGIDTDIMVNENTRFILIVDNLMEISPALKDRCLVVNLSNEISYIDLWKIFCRNREIYNEIMKNEDPSKKIKLPDINFSEWIKNDGIQIDNFDLVHRKFSKLGEVPDILSKKLTNVYNEIIEDRINDMFNFEIKETFFDEDKRHYVLFYKDIIFNVESGLNDKERILKMKNVANSSDNIKCITFIKNLKLYVLSNNLNETCIANIPLSLQELKEELLCGLPTKLLSDISNLKEISQMLSEISLDFKPDFNKEYFNMLKNLESDPLKIYKDFITHEKIQKENEILTDIYKNIKSMYKYGRGEISKLVIKLDQINTKYNQEIIHINKKLDRDFEDFKKLFCNMDLCAYITKSDSIVNKFDDIFDYYLLYLFSMRINSKKCLGSCKGIVQSFDYKYLQYLDQLYNFKPVSSQLSDVKYYNIVANFLSNKDFVDDISGLECNEFGVYLCKFIYSIKNCKGLDIVNLVLEACLNKNTLFRDNEKIDKKLVIPEIYINECLQNFFKVKEIAPILDSRKSILHFDSLIIKNIGDLSNLPLFTKPDELFEKIQDFIKTNKMHKTLNDNILALDNVEQGISDFLIKEDIAYKNMMLAQKLITKYFKNPESIRWPTNYRYYIFLEIHKFTSDLAERFFFDCQVYEFYDRMKFAELRALNISSPLFYNLVLQYKPFEVEDQVDKSLRESQSKLRKEPKLFDKIRDDFINFVSLPVTNILDLKFIKPVCCCKDLELDINLMKFIQNLNEDSSCICDKFSILSEKFNRSNISSIINTLVDKNIKRKDIIDSFYKRQVTDKFSYAEICLSKVINKITDDETHLKLIYYALRNPFPPFLHFIFNFADDDNIEYEDGTGIKGGTGEKNISDKIEDEEEISEEFCEKNEVEEEDGVDFENEGSMSTVDEEEDEKLDDGVDNDNEEEEEEKEEVDEKKDDFEDNEGFGESSEGVNEGVDELNDDEVDDMNDTNDEGNDEILSKEVEDQVLEDKNDIITEYKYKEGKLNQNQTCDEALDYDRRVYGDNLEEALCPGEGTEEIEGNQDKGDKKEYIEHTLNISQKESYSEKLVLLLRNILESNNYNKYKGDYKSGKKLNMKRLIPYIASDYRRDKIWMKRRNSDKKDYILRIFIDNSRSMYSQEMIDTLLILFSRIKNSFKALNIPVQVYRFGNTVEECEISKMTFSDNETNIDWIEDYKDGINIVLTDGVFQKTGFYNKNFLIILIDKNDILNMSKVSVTEGNIFIQKYLDLFSLKYCVIKDIEELESTFILALSELIKNN